MVAPRGGDWGDDCGLGIGRLSAEPLSGEPTIDSESNVFLIWYVPGRL